MECNWQWRPFHDGATQSRQSDYGRNVSREAGRLRTAPIDDDDRQGYARHPSVPRCHGDTKKTCRLSRRVCVIVVNYLVEDFPWRPVKCTPVSEPSAFSWVSTKGPLEEMNSSWRCYHKVRESIIMERACKCVNAMLVSDFRASSSFSRTHRHGVDMPNVEMTLACRPRLRN
jgi:hypothetical protein